jgi:hypothetical protein
MNRRLRAPYSVPLRVAEVFNGRLQKFRPKAGASRALLIGETTHSLSR